VNASAALAVESGYPRRFYAWIAERFPLANGLLFFLVYAAALLGGRRAAGLAPALHLSDLAGFAAAWAFFLMLRVFDEHKDYALDCRLHPERVLQRGLVTLGQLKLVGGLAMALQLGVSLAIDGGVGPVTLRWLVVFAYSLLMLREFFVGHWLSRRLVLYAVSHMVVTPLAVLWMAQMGARGARLDRGAYGYAALSFVLGFCFEIARKMKAPDEERAGVDTYSSLFGAAATVRAIALLWTLAAALVALVLRLDGATIAPTWLGLGALGLALPPVALLIRFGRLPTAASGKAATAAIGLMMLAANLIVIAARVGGRS
jgi:4-hydroxybenzoate polyprenyltransferase